MEQRTTLKKETQNKIDAIRNEYGEALFRMGLAQLISIGFNEAQTFDEKVFDEMLKQYKEEDEKLEAEHKFSLMTPEFKVMIQRVASELSKFNIFIVLKYIQNNLYIEEV